jgi:cell division septation protein DedD
MSYPLGSVGPDQQAEYFAEPEEQEESPRFRGLIITGILLLVVGVFAGSLWFAYVQGLRHASNASGTGDVPLIRADERPTKIKPEKPGGMEVPDRDKLIYTQKRATVEHLLPPPEKPMPRPGASLVAVAPPEAQPTPPMSSAPGAATAPPTEPSAQPQQVVVKPTQKAPSAPNPLAQSVAAQSSPAKVGGRRIQLGSVRTEAAARQEWDRIRRSNSDLLGNLSATPVRADLGDKGIFFRIQAGPVADADRICRELRQRNIGCIIAQ